MLKFGLSLLVFFAHSSFGTTHSYSKNGIEFESQWLKADESKKPGILLIPNWMGVTEESNRQALRFQKLGYNVLVADIYGKYQKPKSKDEAAKISQEFKTNRSQFRERINWALAELKKQKDVDRSSLAVIGYCFGGTGALEAARSGLPLKGVISFHGGLDSPNPKDGKNIKGRVLVLHGAIDPFVSGNDLLAFESEMNQNKVDYEMIKYGRAVHSFTDKTAGNDINKGAAYNASADRKSFQRVEAFLKEVLN